MLLLFSITIADDHLFVESYSFELLCVSTVTVICMCTLFRFCFDDGMWDLVVLVPGHCLSCHFSLF